MTNAAKLQNAITTPLNGISDDAPSRKARRSTTQLRRFQNYEIRTPHRDLRKHLADNGVGTIIQWGGLALHDLTGLGIACNLEEATRFFEETMLLPMNHMLTDEQVDYVIESVQQFFSELGW